MRIKLVMFDLDDTLAKSKCDLERDMANVLEGLMETRFVSVISGAKWEQFHRQVVTFIGPRHYPHLIIAPVSGGQVFRWRNGAWQLVNETSIGISFEQIVAAFERAFDEVGFERPKRLWGPQFENRVCQVTFSALGQEAPHEAKRTWDPDFKKRMPVIDALKRILPSYLSVRAGGSTSIDVSGFEKDYGIRQVVLQMKKEEIAENEVLFVGDAVFPNGNDYSVTKTKALYLLTRGLEDTKAIVARLLLDEEYILSRAGQGPMGAGAAAPTLD